MIEHVNIDLLKVGADIICHQVNCLGIMGTGIAKQIKETYPSVFSEYTEYVTMHKDRRLLLGKVLFSKSKNSQVIANMFGQLRYGYKGVHTNYKALEKCLQAVAKIGNGRTIAVPYKLGCGAGGGDWKIVSMIIYDTFVDYPGKVIICRKD